MCARETRTARAFPLGQAVPSIFKLFDHIIRPREPYQSQSPRHTIIVMQKFSSDDVLNPAKTLVVVKLNPLGTVHLESLSLQLS
jgi:hypothetical protein